MSAPVPDPGGEDVVEAGPGHVRVPGVWATGVRRLHGTQPARNVEGRLLTGPQQGFGRLYQRRYTADIGEVATPQRAVAEWKAGFGSFWPRDSHFLGTVGSIVPGDVAPIAISAAPGVSLATGVLVLYADDESFTFMTPQGHMFGGWITFSAMPSTAVPGSTLLEVSILVRANDPLYEAGMALMMRKEDTAWETVLRNLAAHLGVTDVRVDEDTVVIDRRRLWHNWTNVWHNAGVRSVLWSAGQGVRTVVVRIRRPRQGSNLRPSD